MGSRRSNDGRSLFGIPRIVIALRSNVNIRDDSGIRIYLPEGTLTDSDRKEFSANEKYEATLANQPEESVIFDDVLFKADFIKTFKEVESKIDLRGEEAVLELGASHGWACVMLKRKFPKCQIVASDLVADTIRHSSRWERLLGCEIDEKWALNCRDMPFESEQFDRIFTFASFHHFAIDGSFSASLAEMLRVLKPGGKIALLYEPSSPEYLYKFAFNRVNRKRAHEGVDEDVVVTSRVARDAEALGAHCTYERFPHFKNRSSVASTLYYLLLSKMGPLAAYLVCTVNIVIEKPKAA